jgi:fucose permease
MLILAAILGIFVYGVVATTWGSVLSPTLGFEPGVNGSIAMWNGIGLVVASLAVGPLIDLKGKKLALLTGLTLICLSFWALPSVGKDPGLVRIMLTVLGLGGGIVVTGANALVSDVSESRRGTMLNLLNLFFGLGGLLTPLMKTDLLGDSAVAMCYVAAAMATVTFIVNVIAPMPKPTGERGFKGSEIGLVVGRPALYLLALFLFLYVACEVGVWNWLVEYLTKVRGLETGTAQHVLSLGFALGLLIGRIVVSRLLINISALQVTLGAAVAMAVTTFWMLQSTSPSAAWVAVFCAGMAMAPMFPTTLAMVGDAFPRMSATAMGIVITCGWLGLVVSSPIIGNVANSSGLGTALLLLPAFSAAMIAVNLGLRPLLKKRS